jgi:hypothetical protein
MLANAVHKEMALSPAPFWVSRWRIPNTKLTDATLQGWTSTLMSNPTLWHAQFRRPLPSSNKLQPRQLATPLNAP